MNENLQPSLETVIQLFETKLNSSSFWWFSLTSNEDHFMIPLFEKVKKKSRIKKYNLYHALHIVKTQLREMDLNKLKLNSMDFEKLVWNYNIILEVLTYLTGLMNAFKLAEKHARYALEKDPVNGKKEYRRLLNDAQSFWKDLMPKSDKLKQYFLQATGKSLESYMTLLSILGHHVGN